MVSTLVLLLTGWSSVTGFSNGVPPATRIQTFGISALRPAMRAPDIDLHYRDPSPRTGIQVRKYRVDVVRVNDVRKADPIMPLVPSGAGTPRWMLKISIGH
jgi:hypothetical protein